MIWASCVCIVTVIIEFFYQSSIDNQATVSKELEESNDHKEKEGSSDSDYSSSQLESSDSSIVEDDSSNLSQTSSEELPEASEKNRSTLNPLSENLKGKLLHYCMCESQKYYWHTENLCTAITSTCIIFLVNYQQINKRKAVILTMTVVNSLNWNPVTTVLRLKWKMTLQAFLRLL